MLKQGFFIAGTGTDVGKTVVSSWMLVHLGADYWKPVQSGMNQIDRATAREISGLTPDHFHPSTYELVDPLVPIESARRMGITLDHNRFVMPVTPRPLLVEGAGGLMVPINEEFLMIDLIAKLGLPIVLVCSSKIGTINHTLLSLEAIRSRKLPLLGVVMNGPLLSYNKEAVESFGQVKVLAEIPQMESITADKLRSIRPHVPFSRWNQEELLHAVA